MKPAGFVEGIQSSGSPPGSLLACMPSLHLGETGAGEMVLNDFPLRVIMPSSYGTFANPAFAGILGGDALERFHVTLDLHNASIYFKPDPDFRPDPFEFSTIGIQFFKAEAKAFSVVAVWKNSPAEAAGIAVGDRLLAVNGQNSVVLGLEEFASQLHGAAGTPIVIEVERAQKKFTVTMKTRQLVCGLGGRTL